ncbi:MAG TPA: hypothetical protein VHX12_10310, partial [Acidisoma sp.]|nr:hypothetical protein [Acidisoma sp.]
MSAIVSFVDEDQRPAAEASKVPLATSSFWIIKILTTAMGEAVSDYLMKSIGPEYAIPLGTAGFAAALLIQFSVK